MNRYASYTAIILTVIVVIATVLALRNSFSNETDKQVIPVALEQNTTSQASPTSQLPGPLYEELMQRLKRLIGGSESNTQITPEQWDEWNRYKEELVGKTVEWSGWVTFVVPDKITLDETGPYNGDARLQLDMTDPKAVSDEPRVTVVLDGLTLDQVKDLRKWYDPLGQVGLEEVKFSGTITAVTGSPLSPLIVISALSLSITR